LNSADTTQWADADTLQPSQFLIDQGRLDALERCFTPQQVSPIPVRYMDGRLVMLDGHHRACALLRRGADRLPIVHDGDHSISLPLYRTCVAACRARGVLSARSLTGCIVSPQVFRRDWDSYCDELHAHEDYAADPCGSAALRGHGVGVVEVVVQLGVIVGPGLALGLFFCHRILLGAVTRVKRNARPLERPGVPVPLALVGARCDCAVSELNGRPAD